MLHTTLDKARGTLPIDAIESANLPKADYYALGHLHIDFQFENFVYPGPIFPNNFQELEDLKNGSFYIVDTSTNKLEKIELKLKDVLNIFIRIENATNATDKILAELEKHELKDKIVLLRIAGELDNGKVSDIKFQTITEFVKNKGAYFLLKNTHDLKSKELELTISSEIQSSENIEKETIEFYSKENPSDFNKLIPEIINTLSIEKQEGEKNDVFEKRLLDSAKKILRFECS